MRKIKIEKWMAKTPQGEMEETLLKAIDVLIAVKKPETMPRGIEKFRIMGKIASAFEKAEETNVLELEEKEYEFLKDTIEKEVPATWAMNKNLNKAITSFLEAKDE